MGTRHGNHTWEPGMETTHGNQGWKPHMGTREPGMGTRQGNKAVCLLASTDLPSQHLGQFPTAIVTVYLVKHVTAWVGGATTIKLKETVNT